MEIPDFVYEIPDNLEPEICTEIIDRFENDWRKHPGKIGTYDGIKLDENMKVSTDLPIQSYEDWQDIFSLLQNKLVDALQRYSDHIVNTYGKQYKPILHKTLKNKKHINPTFQVQSTNVGGYFREHHDAAIQFTKSATIIYRVMTYIWYLNDVNEGYTDFLYKKVKPELGKLVLFPASWFHIHSGKPPEGTKYIVTGWIYNEWKPNSYAA